MKRVLITGSSSSLGRALSGALLAQGIEVYGVDRRPWPDAPSELTFEVSDLRKRAAQQFVLQARPDAIVHLATVTHVFEQSKERYRMNLEGTRALFEVAQQLHTPHVLFVGRHTYYGAAADAAMYHREEEPPAQVGQFPELADLVAADLYASTALWRMPETVTTLLRPCYTLGPSGRGTLAAFLGAHASKARVRGGFERVVPTVLGYDPLFQFVHEDDLVTALQLALEHRPRGVFNVAGPPPLPLSVIVREVGRRVLPLPEPVLRGLLGPLGLLRLSPEALEHIKYPIVIDDAAFRSATGYAAEHSAAATLAAFRASFP